MRPDTDPVSDLFIIADPELDVVQLMARLRENLAARGEVLPGLEPDPTEQRLEAALARARDTLASLGTLEIHREGWAGRLESFARRLLRKAIKPHLLHGAASDQAIFDLVLALLDRQFRLQQQYHQLATRMAEYERHQ